MTDSSLFLGSSGEVPVAVMDTTMEQVPQLLTPVNHGIFTDVARWIADVFPMLSGYSDLEIWALMLVVLVWILTILWVLKDSTARSDSVGYQFFSALLVTVLSPVVGLPLYLAFRPLSYRWERGYWREALMNTVTICPHCEQIVDKSYNACVYCGESLKTECKECHQKYTRGYAYCPECWAPNLE